MSRLLLFNKPFDVLSQFTDRQGTIGKTRKTLKEFIDLPEVKVAGRLDRDSEGLLILSDSGALIHKITHPGNHMSKNYWAQVEGQPTPAQLQPLRDGIELADGPCLPAKCDITEPHLLWPRQPPIRVRKTIPTTWLSITISEGRNRQVRRMCAAAGFPVLRLIRYRVGSWTLDGLRPGEHRIVHLDP